MTQGCRLSSIIKANRHLKKISFTFNLLFKISIRFFKFNFNFFKFSEILTTVNTFVKHLLQSISYN